MTTARDLIPVMTERIVKQFHPLKVILFGSHARGTERPDSDVDLLVVLPECSDKRKVILDIQRGLADMHVSTDVVIATPDEIAREGTLVGTVLRPALREGQALYARDGGGQPVSESDPAQVPVIVRRWLRQVRRDLRTAQLSIDDIEPGVEAVCYHAQQAAEKALKAVLIFLQMEYPYSHNLDDLRNLIPDGWRLKEEYPNRGDLTRWSVEARYPGEGREPEEADARQAFQLGRAVYDAVLRDLQAHGFDPGPQAQVASATVPQTSVLE